MSFIKLDDIHQTFADLTYSQQKSVMDSIDHIIKMLGNDDKWFPAGLLQIEQGFMSIRKGITERYKISEKFSKDQFAMAQFSICPIHGERSE